MVRCLSIDMCWVEGLVGVVGRVYVGVGAWVRRIEYDVMLTSRSDDLACLVFGSET